MLRFCKNFGQTTAAEEMLEFILLLNFSLYFSSSKDNIKNDYIQQRYCF